MITKKYEVVGMHCASCASIIKKKLSKVDGVKSVDVNYATEVAELSTTKNIDDSKFNSLISPLGYSIKPTDPNPPMGHPGHDMSRMDHSLHAGHDMGPVGTSPAKKAEKLADLAS
jgi:Cu2+-exporting ATPase/Cu+-exporting ATPase